MFCNPVDSPPSVVHCDLRNISVWYSPMLMSDWFLSQRRVLLLGVAILSLYSVHLLLMTAKEGGRCHFLTHGNVCLSSASICLSSPFCFFPSVSLNITHQHIVVVLTGSLIYEKLGERAFGWPGKMAAFGSITLQNIGGK